MDKNEFDNLSINEQLEIVNSESSKGISLNKFAQSMGVTESKIRKRFNKLGYFKNKESGLYEFREGFVPAPKSIKTASKNTSKKQTSSEDQNILEKIQQLENELKTLKLEVEELKSNPNKSEVTKEDNCDKKQPENLVIRDFNGELKQISYRYDLEVLEAFEKLCTVYPHFTKQKILNTLLMEAIEKYL